MNTLKNIGQQIQTLRKANKINQKDFAEKSKLSRESIRLIENGSINISINNLESIATALNCELEINFKQQ